VSLVVEPSPLLLHSLGKVDALLNPRNIVILGASDTPGNWSQRVWRNVHRYRFPGPVYPLNPRRDQIWDTRCYRSFAALPETPDHVVVVIPAASVPDALIEASRAGARSATVLTAGFAESTDPSAGALSTRLKAVIAQTGLAVSGPNCFGNLHARASLMTMPDDRLQRLANGPVAIIGQSGGLSMSIKRSLEERGIDAGSVVTSGNQAGLSSADYIAYYAMNDDIRVIVAYLESVQNPATFMAACRMARSAGKPIVVMKLGASAEGRAAALAHTGALAGAMEAFDAVAGASGVLRVRTVDDIAEAVEYFLHAPALPFLPGGFRLGAITFSGALRGLLLDAAAAHGLSVAALTETTVRRLEAVLGVGTIIGNPLDSGFTGLTNREGYVKCVAAMLDDPGIDLVLLQAELPRAPGMDRAEANMRAVEVIATQAKKPIVQFSIGSHGVSDYGRAFRAQLPHLPCLQEVDKTLRVVRAISDYARRATQGPPVLPAVASHKGKVLLEKTLAHAARLGFGKVLNEVQSKQLLKAYGIRGPKEAVARSAKEAVAIAKRIGFPVVAKGVSAALPHKSDAGAVMLGLDSPAAVRAAYEQIVEAITRVPTLTPGREGRRAIEGVLIAEQVSGGIELVLGANLDPEVGPVILFGTGGIALELYRDVALAPPPLDEGRALALIDATRAGQLVRGYRGRPALDLKAAVAALIGLSGLMMDAGTRIQSIDINPFLLRKRGGVALDGLVVLADHGA
jgi:acyl-CoA synthetase (NDP forming)